MTAINYTRDTKLASCLCTLGFPLREEDPIIHIVENGKKIITYYFSSASACGKWSFSDVCRMWADNDLHKKDPENPINYIKAAFHNRERLLDLINKAQPIGLIQRGNKSLLISLNASQQLKDKLFRML